MHRDLKLGLALAVLLVGATTAFFFRTETDIEGGLPQLQNPERLDAELAGRDVVPYLGAPETDAPEVAAASPWSKPAFLGGSSAPVRRTSVTPDPIRILLEEEAELIEPGPSLLPAPVVEPRAAAHESPPQSATVATGEIMHVVQSGDTLSGLAGRYLGDIGRFGEIFELNRDRLSAPNALKIGMEIRIPPKDGLASATTSAPESSGARTVTEVPSSGEAVATPSESSAEVGEPKPDEQKMFVPARKTPFVPSRYRSGGVPSAEAESPTDPERE